MLLGRRRPVEAPPRRDAAGIGRRSCSTAVDDRDRRDASAPGFRRRNGERLDAPSPAFAGPQGIPHRRTSTSSRVTPAGFTLETGFPRSVVQGGVDWGATRRAPTPIARRDVSTPSIRVRMAGRTQPVVLVAIGAVAYVLLHGVRGSRPSPGARVGRRRGILHSRALSHSLRVARAGSRRERAAGHHQQRRRGGLWPPGSLLARRAPARLIAFSIFSGADWRVLTFSLAASVVVGMLTSSCHARGSEGAAAAIARRGRDIQHQRRHHAPGAQHADAPNPGRGGCRSCSPEPG